MLFARRLPWWSSFALLALALLLILFALVWPLPSHAQQVPGKLNLSWTLPTTGCIDFAKPETCGPLTGSGALTEVRVYISPQPIPANFAGAASITLAPTATTAQHTQTVPNGSTLYVRVRVCNSSGCSAISNQAEKLIDVPLLPGAPVVVSIDFVIDLQP